MVDGKVTSKKYDEISPQVVECLIVLEVLKTFPGPLNIISDSSYMVNAVNMLEVAGLIKPSSKLAQIFQQIQSVLLSRRHPVYITMSGLIRVFLDQCPMEMIWQIGPQE